MILQPDAKCVSCGANILHRNKRHRLAMHVGVEETRTGPRHSDCGLHELEEIKRKKREQRQEK